MSRTKIPGDLRQRVSDQARRRCGSCLTREEVVGCPMQVDHLIPESLGGPTEEDNLWLACSLCNDHKSDRISPLDPPTGKLSGCSPRAGSGGSNTLNGPRGAL